MSVFDDLILLDNTPSKQKSRCVVRLRTSYWASKDRINIKKELIFLRRRSVGYPLLYEDLDATGAEDVVVRITNLDQCSDGIYEVHTCNEYRDRETGYIDDYDYVLVPYEDLS